MNGIDLTPLLQAVLSLVAAVITMKLIPWIAGKTSLEQRKALSLVVRTLVMAAEQVYGSSHGREKMAYVQCELREHGYTVDIAAIEAAVMEMSKKLLKNERKEDNE